MTESARRVGGLLLLSLALVLPLAVYAERVELPSLDETPLPRLQAPAQNSQQMVVQNGLQGETSAAFEAGVKAYREGNYRQAGKVFEALHRQAPEHAKVTYYLAITAAQLGRFQQAKSLYGEILTLDPNGEAAQLAQEGLKYLPPETSLDLPPRFSQANASVGVEKATGLSPAGTGGATGASSTTPPGMSAQDLMAWQMLMGQNNNNNNSSSNWMSGLMPNMMMGGQGNSSNGTSAGGMSGFDPAMMSTMMMNQMMQSLTPGGDSNDNR